MALASTMVWEIKSTGATDNGGGFDSAVAGGADYSQSDAAALSLVDLYFTSGTTLKSDTGGFDADMVGNVICIHAGTHFTVGWYEVMTRVSTYEVTLDRAPATEDTTAHKDAHGKLGGAFAMGSTSTENEFWMSVVAGNTIYLCGGGTNPGTTYTLTEYIGKTNSGTAVLPIHLIGYNSTRGEASCNGALRPTIAGGTYYPDIGDYWRIRNIIFTSAGTYTLTSFNSADIWNCKCVNTSGTATRTCFNMGTTINIIGCEGQSWKGRVFYGTSASCHISYCYAHDSEYGVQHTGSRSTFIGNVFESCFTAGMNLANIITASIVGNTIRNCGIGILGTTGTDDIFFNNLIADCLTPFSWSTPSLTLLAHHNCEYGNTNADSGVTQIGLVTGNPLFNGAIAKGTDGVTEADSHFTAASAPFAGVTTSDVLIVLAVGDPAAVLGVYPITTVVSTSHLVLDLTYWTIGASKGTTAGITYGVVKGTDFTLAVGSSCIGTGFDASLYSGVTV